MGRTILLTTERRADDDINGIFFVTLIEGTPPVLAIASNRTIMKRQEIENVYN